MPSINRPTWRGVSTTSEQSTYHYIVEGLRNLERSTTLIRQNLSNLVPNHDDPNTENLEEIIVPDLSEGNVKDELMDINASNLVTNVQQILARNEDLKQKVEKVLQENEAFKQDIKNYLDQNTIWKQEFLEKSKRIDMELRSVVLHHPEQSQYRHRKKSSGWTSRKLRSWCDIASEIGRNTFMSLKRKWNSLEFGNVAVMPLNFNNRNRNSVLHIRVA